MADVQRIAELAARVEAAEENVLIGETTKALLAEAWNLLNPRPPHRVSRRPDGQPWGGDGLGPITAEHQEWDKRREFYFGCLNLGAFESAAMTLVPEGWAIDRWQIWPGAPSTLDLLETERDGDLWVRNGWLEKVEAVAATPALALTAAALRAHAAQGARP